MPNHDQCRVRHSTNAIPEGGIHVNPITLTRAELYDLVWETPTSHLAKQFGLSDVGLAKTCTRLVSAHHNHPCMP